MAGPFAYGSLALSLETVAHVRRAGKGDGLTRVGLYMLLLAMVGLSWGLAVPTLAMLAMSVLIGDYVAAILSAFAIVAIFGLMELALIRVCRKLNMRHDRWKRT